jgi:hypothetical protein
VDVVAGEREVPAPPVPETSAVATKSQAHVPAFATLRSKGSIEVVLPGGTLVRVDAHVVQRHPELTPWRQQELTPSDVSLFD